MLFAAMACHYVQYIEVELFLNETKQNRPRGKSDKKSTHIIRNLSTTKKNVSTYKKIYIKIRTSRVLYMYSIVNLNSPTYYPLEK